VDPTGKYTENCAAGDAACRKRTDEFEKGRQRQLKSSDKEIAAAARAYGDRGVKNGVTLTIQNAQVAANCARNASGCVVPRLAADSSGKITSSVNVFLEEGLTGKSLDSTLVHEGVHVSDQQGFLKTLSQDLLVFSGNLNFTHEMTETKAYTIGHRVMGGQAYEMGKCGNAACRFSGTDIDSATLQQFLQDPQNGYSSKLNNWVFPPADWPQGFAEP